MSLLYQLAAQYTIKYTLHIACHRQFFYRFTNTSLQLSFTRSCKTWIVTLCVTKHSTSLILQELCHINRNIFHPFSLLIILCIDNIAAQDTITELSPEPIQRSMFLIAR